MPWKEVLLKYITSSLQKASICGSAVYASGALLVARTKMGLRMMYRSSKTGRTNAVGALGAIAWLYVAYRKIPPLRYQNMLTIDTAVSLSNGNQHSVVCPARVYADSGVVSMV